MRMSVFMYKRKMSAWTSFLSKSYTVTRLANHSVSIFKQFLQCKVSKRYITYKNML